MENVYFGVQLKLIECASEQVDLVDFRVIPDDLAAAFCSASLQTLSGSSRR
jgi:hypothetical protein